MDIYILFILFISLKPTSRINIFFLTEIFSWHSVKAPKYFSPLKALSAVCNTLQSGPLWVARGHKLASKEVTILSLILVVWLYDTPCERHPPKVETYLCVSEPSSEYQTVIKGASSGIMLIFDGKVRVRWSLTLLYCTLQSDLYILLNKSSSDVDMLIITEEINRAMMQRGILEDLRTKQDVLIPPKLSILHLWKQMSTTHLISVVQE